MAYLFMSAGFAKFYEEGDFLRDFKFHEENYLHNLFEYEFTLIQSKLYYRLHDLAFVMVFVDMRIGRTVFQVI